MISILQTLQLNCATRGLITACGGRIPFPFPPPFKPPSSFHGPSSDVKMCWIPSALTLVCKYDINHVFHTKTDFPRYPKLEPYIKDLSAGSNLEHLIEDSSMRNNLFGNCRCEPRSPQTWKVLENWAASWQSFLPSGFSGFGLLQMSCSQVKGSTPSLRPCSDTRQTGL